MALFKPRASRTVDGQEACRRRNGKGPSVQPAAARRRGSARRRSPGAPESEQLTVIGQPAGQPAAKLAMKPLPTQDFCFYIQERVLGVHLRSQCSYVAASF